MNLRDLAAPFPASDVEWRVQSAGKNDRGVWARVLAYINNRAIMERLDDVVGPGNWRNEYRHESNGAVMCGLSIKIGDEWVTKWDGAEKTDIEAVKGGLSNAMKRAGVQWGIGRYLYQLEEGYAKVGENGEHYQGAKKDAPGKPGYPAFRWTPPALPAWALPGGSGKPGAENGTRAAARQSTQVDNGRAPQSIAGDGRAKSPATASAVPSAPAKPDEEKVWGGKTLGEHTKDELQEIINEFAMDSNAQRKALVKACRNVLNNRLLGPPKAAPAPRDDSDDAAVSRMKAGVAAEADELPFN